MVYNNEELAAGESAVIALFEQVLASARCSNIAVTLLIGWGEAGEEWGVGSLLTFHTGNSIVSILSYTILCVSIEGLD